MSPPPDQTLDTFPKLLVHHARTRPTRPAIREKEFGIWQTWNWAGVLDEVRDFACGLSALGFQRGEKVAIIGDNRPRLYWAIIATQSLGGIPVPVYQDSVADEMAFVLDHAEVRFAVAEDQEQVDKLLQVRDRVPRLERVIYDDPRGMRNYDHSRLVPFTEVQAEGRKRQAADPGFFERELGQGQGSDPSIILYTSGTTGQPKGVVLSYDNIRITAANAVERDGLNDGDEVLAYLPMAWVGDHVFSFAQAYVAGFCINCPESSATVLTDLRELGPTYFFAPPRIYENILTTVMIRMEDAAWIKRKLFHYFLGVARRIGLRLLEGSTVSRGERWLYGLGEALVYGPLKNVLGFSRIRIAYTAGEAIGPDLFNFYRSLGMNVKQLYGMTETAVLIVMQPNGQVRPDTVGTPCPQVEVRIADSGEVHIRCPGVFQEYYKNADATREAKTEDGWFLTGDAGYFTEDGHLKIIDRAKDVGRINGGAMFAPKYIENKLKFFPFIKEAVTFGNGQDHVAAFINIDLEAVGNWAERRNLAYSGYTDLARRAEVYDLIQGCVEQVNRDLAADRHLSGSQIARYLILHKELDADDGELTRTRKVRRNFIAERYAELIDALYSGKTVCHVEAVVKFEDGRKGKISAEVHIRDAKVVPVAATAIDSGPQPMRKAG